MNHNTNCCAYVHVDKLNDLNLHNDAHAQRKFAGKLDNAIAPGLQANAFIQEIRRVSCSEHDDLYEILLNYDNV